MSATLVLQIAITGLVVWAGFAATSLGCELDRVCSRYSTSETRTAAGMIAGLLGVMAALLVTVVIWTQPSVWAFGLIAAVVGCGYWMYRGLRRAAVRGGI